MICQQKIYRLIVILLLTVVVGSCRDEEETISHILMSDGQIISVDNKNVKYYNSEIDFIKGCDADFTHSYTFLQNDSITLEKCGVYSVCGYDERFVGAWELTKFGEWISDYDLNPDELYYSASIMYIKYLPVPPIGCMVCPLVRDNDIMGYLPTLSEKSFRVVYMDNLTILMTLSRCVGYDEATYPIMQEIPILKNNIIWNFSIIENSWE